MQRTAKRQLAAAALAALAAGLIVWSAGLDLRAQAAPVVIWP